MSHFTVLVCLATGEDLEEALLPYHEYECTGIERYIEFVDKTDEVTKDYNTDTTERWRTLEDFAREYHGYTVNDDGRIGRYTNPNAKWDGYAVGGRWSNLLILKDKRGRRLSTARRRTDDARAGDVDWQAMGAADLEKALARYDLFAESLAEYADAQPVEDGWDAEYTAEDERGKYLRSVYPDALTHWRTMQAKRKAESHNERLFGVLSTHDEIKRYLAPRDEFSARVQAQAHTYALLHNGRWIEQGDMGWFGCDTPTTEYDYDKLWWETVNALPADTHMVVVDCHI
jgi:hypothetical protein